MDWETTRQKISQGLRASLGPEQVNVDDMSGLSMQELRAAIGAEHEELRRAVHASKKDLDVFVAELQMMVPDLTSEEILLIRTDPACLDLALHVIARETLEYVVNQRMLDDFKKADPTMLNSKSLLQSPVARELLQQHGDYLLPDDPKLYNMFAQLKALNPNDLGQLMSTFMAENPNTLNAVFECNIKNMAEDYTRGLCETAAAEALKSAEWVEKRDKVLTMCKLMVERPDSLHALLSNLELDFDMTEPDTGTNPDDANPNPTPDDLD